jgi:hypothetical protein
VVGGAATEDTSGSRCLDRTGLRADHRHDRAVSLRQAGVALVQLEDSSEPATVGAYHQTGEFDLRFLLMEAAQVTVRGVPEWRSQYLNLMMRRGRKIARLRWPSKLAVRLSGRREVYTTPSWAAIANGTFGEQKFVI